MGSGLSSRSGLAHKSALAIGAGWKGFVNGVGWKNSNRCSGVASRLWTELSFGFGAQKRARYMGCRPLLEDEEDNGFIILVHQDGKTLETPETWQL